MTTTSKPAPKESSTAFTAEERAAMKARADEVRASRGRAKGKAAAEAQAVQDAIAALPTADRALAEKLHVLVTEAAPELAPKTWYGMPAYANAAGKVVVSFKDSGKFGQRYSTLEFQDSAHLDDGDIWPVGFAMIAWTPEVEEKVAALVRAAVS